MLNMSRILAVFLVGALIVLIVFLLTKKKTMLVLNPMYQALASAIKTQTRLNNYPDSYILYLLGQSLHETGLLTSHLIRSHNNFFGMKYPKKRKTTAIGATESGFSRYKSVNDSVKDLMLWFDYVRFPKGIDSIEEYIATLKTKQYYEDSYLNYLNGVKSALKTVN